MFTLRGVYKDGFVTFFDDPPFEKEYQVLGTFLEPDLEVTILSKENRDMTVDQIRESRLGLTKRELVILRFAREGMRAQDISDHLKVARGSIGTSVGNIYKKLSVRTLNGAVKKAIELGLLEPLECLFP